MDWQCDNTTGAARLDYPKEQARRKTQPQNEDQARWAAQKQQRKQSNLRGKSRQ